MALKRLTQRHKEIVMMWMKGEKVARIAEHFTLHPWSVYRILEDPLAIEFRVKVEYVRTKALVKELVRQDEGMLRELTKMRLNRAYGPL